MEDLKDGLKKVGAKQVELERKEQDAAAFMQKLNGETSSVREWLTAIREKQALNTSRDN